MYLLTEFFLAEVEANGVNAMFENNVINWLVLIGFVIWIMSKNLPPMLKAREDNINLAISQAKEAREMAHNLLQKQESSVANAQAEEEAILSEARSLAEQMKVQIAEQTQKDNAEMNHKFAQAIQGERQLLVNELRQATIKAAVQLTEAQLQSQTNHEVKGQLLNQFMEQLETLNPKGSAVATQSFQSASK